MTTLNKRAPATPPPAPAATTDFILRKVDTGVWSQFRARATQDGHTARWVLLTLITHYVRHGLPRGGQ